MDDSARSASAVAAKTTETFAFGGMLFAIPAIMISKVVITTTFRQLRAYDII